MSKRYNRLPIQTVSAKRPKIENDEHDNNTISIKTSNKFNFKTSVSVSKTIKKVPSMSGLSDDDDDDLLVLVSTQVEEKVKKNVFIPPPSDALSESFSAVFSAGAHIKTSTQMFAPPPKEPEADVNKEFEAWDDDDLLLSQFNIDENMAKLAKQKEQNRAKPGSSKDQDGFKVPGAIVRNQNHAEIMEQSVILPSQMTVSDEARSNMQQRRQKAMESKIKFLEGHAEKMEEMKKKAEKKAEMLDAQLKALDKERNSLKYEIKNLKQMMDGLRKDKLTDSEKINREWKERVSELENELKLREIELAQKTIEIMNVTMKQGTPGKKQKQDREGAKIDFSDIYAICHRMYAIPRTQMRINSLVFTEIDEKHIRNREICVKQYDSLTMGLSKLFITDAPSPALVQQVIPAIKTVLRLIYRYALKLNKTNPEEYKFVPLAEVKLLAGTLSQNRPLELCKIHPHQQPSIFDACENVKDEKILVARRCLAVISEMCRSKVFVTVFMSDPSLFLKKLNLIVRIVGASDEYAEYSALMSSTITIVINIYAHFRSCKNTQNERHLFELIKSVIHCRIMNFVTLHKISQMLQTLATNQDRQFLMYFCTKNCDMIRKSDLAAGICRFTSDSCPLQVFGACLETSIRFNGVLDASKIHLIAEIIINLQHFLTASEDLQVPWIYQPPVGDHTPICPCMPKLICGYIQIFSACLREFRNNPSIIDMKTMCFITKSSVILLGRTFEQYEQYQIDIFTYGCGALMTVKASYKVAVAILNRFQVQFEFESIHEKALEILNSPKILMDYEDEDKSQGPETGDNGFDSMEDYVDKY